jgi:tRNA-Thr(GGU) m(6)t(6)A37 methyltransferase TsaA
MTTPQLDRQPVLRGDLLELRPLRGDDFDALFEVASDPLIWEQHPEPTRYQESVFRDFFAEAMKSGGALVAIDRATGAIIGSSRYHGYDPERRVVEIGWTFLARAYWGGRYNGEMKRLMLEHAFPFVDRVIFVIGPENRRSQRAVEKIGGVHAGGMMDLQGRARVVYELTPAMYDSAQRAAAGRSLPDLQFHPIGVVRSPFMSTAAIPKGLGAKHDAEGTIEIRPELAAGLMDVEGFSHLYVIWVFDRSAGPELTAYPPSDDRPHGVFATRSPQRPNPIGLTVVELLDRTGTSLRVRGIDMLDGTPVLDIKPYLSNVPSDTLRRGWLDEVERRTTK